MGWGNFDEFPELVGKTLDMYIQMVYNLGNRVSSRKAKEIKMKRQFTIEVISNMKPKKVAVTAKLWKNKRWYVDVLGGSFCLDAITGKQIKTRRQVNNPYIISQVKKELGF